jgi:hypothetical protein
VRSAIATSLAGAYHRQGHPLEQRRLVVELQLPLALVFHAVDVRATVHVEGIALAADAQALLRAWEGRSTLAAEFLLESDDGTPHVITVSSTITRFDVRALTELTGTIRTAAAVIGPVKLRVDWRGAVSSSK